MSTYVGDPFAPLPAGQAASFFYQQRQLDGSTPAPTTQLDVQTIGTVENLAVVFDLMRRENGPAPGPDGLSYPHLGRRELFDVLRPVSRAILDGTYKPGPARDVKIPKAGNRGYRTLSLRNLLDRVVAKALNEALVPFWEERFLAGSHGYRPGRSNKTMLAGLERAVIEQDRWVLVSDDVSNAFPSVNIDLLLEHHRQHLRNNELLLRLVEVVLRGGDPTRKVGLDQGCLYMPTALNVFLHHVFDEHAHDLGANPGLSTPWFRYADNLVVACRDVREGEQVLLQMSKRLQAAGLALKGENGGQPVNLKRGGQVQLLGFVLFKQGNQLGYKLGEGAWDSLKKNLLRAHASRSPAATAQAVVKGWLDAFGPAFHKRQDRSVTYLLRLAASLGYRELYDHGYYLDRCKRAYHGWRQLVRDQYDFSLHG